MKKKSIFILLIISLMVGSFLTACGSDSGSSGTSDNSTRIMKSINTNCGSSSCI